jgi:hypothetical protein
MLGDSGVDEIDATMTMDVEVDEARDRESCAGRSQADSDDLPVLDRDVAVDELPVDDRSADSESRWCSCDRRPPSSASFSQVGPQRHRSCSSPGPGSSDTRYPELTTELTGDRRNDSSA